MISEVNGKYHYRICLSHFPRSNENGETVVTEGTKTSKESETRTIPPCNVYAICQEYTHMLKREWYFTYKHKGWLKISRHIFDNISISVTK